MKKLVFTSLAIAALGSCAGTGSRSALDGKMAELNENLSRSGEFVDAFHGRVSELRSRLATAREDSLKSEIEYSLYKEYQNFNTDSAKAWMTLMMEHPDAGFPIDVLQAWKYAIDGDKDNFKKMFEAFDPGRVDARYRNDCYATLASSYLLLSPTDRRLCQFMTNADNDPATETDVQEMFLGTMRRHENDQLEAREHFMRAYQASSTTHMQSKTAYLLAHTYRETGDNDEYEYWLAQSAIHDLHVPVKSYSAFQDLAMAELERGRFKSASDMVEVFLKDALESKYWVRVNKAVEYEQKIIAKVNRAEKTSICGLMLSTILLLIILVLLLILLKKNDGAVCIEDFAGTKVSICNAMCSNEGEDGVSQYGKALAAQREYYRNGSFIKKQAGVISSAPLLIYDYHPYGTTFVPTISSSAINSYAYEHPFHHQGVRHPRSAVGIDGDGHILLIVADGRYTSICDGFTAKELTNFLIKYFDPKYALNMDGGGSSTMCVSGLGDESTNVVNYPCDDGKATHSGERTVQSFLYVVKK